MMPSLDGKIQFLQDRNIQYEITEVDDLLDYR